jgi:peptidoglycan/xylan/chitin deacetylase (PgdA/CDA1 family)
VKLTRREFAFSTTAATLGATTPAPRVAITMDDFRWRGIPGGDPKKPNRALLDALAKHSNLKAALFVCGINVDQPAGRQLLQSWSDAGHIIGNHTYSHPSYNSPKVTAASFGADLLHAEEILKGFPSFQKILRFPFLKEGDTAPKRDAMRAFLAAHGYRTGHVTIDASDWYFDQRLHARLEKDPVFDTHRYREPYLEHMLDRATYYDNLARAVLNRTIPHTILVHYNLLNVLFLDDLLTMFERNGWQLVSAETAFKDEVFKRQPNIVPAGESLIWALAKESGRFEAKLRYPGESDEYEKAKLDRLGL